MPEDAPPETVKPVGRSKQSRQQTREVWLVTVVVRNDAKEILRVQRNHSDRSHSDYNDATSNAPYYRSGLKIDSEWEVNLACRRREERRKRTLQVETSYSNSRWEWKHCTELQE